MANGMASLMIGATGLKSAQAGLNTTAHNLSNLNTVGYTRQQLGLQDTQYVKLNNLGSPISSTYGLGVGVSEIRRIRDTFIDKAYRTENSRLGYYDSQYKAVEEIEDQFGEMQGVTYQECLNDLEESLNELNKEPASTVKRASLIQTASALMTRSDAVYNGLVDYQKTLNTDVYNMINKINSLGQTIYSLNKQISKIECTGIEVANDLRDQRDVALDELSGYISMTYHEDDNGEVMVNLETVPFVTATAVTEMSYRTTNSGLYIPTFPAFSTDVYPDESLYGVTSTDKGELRGLLLARGSVDVDYTDIPVKPDKDDDKYYTTATDANGNETKTFNTEKYNSDYAIYEQKQAYYNKYIEPSAILCAIAGVDKLVNGICTTLNEVLCPTISESRTSALTVTSGGETYELIPDSYEYTGRSESVLYDASGNEVNGAPVTTTDASGNVSTTYSYSSRDKLCTKNVNTTTNEVSYNPVTPSAYNYSYLDQDNTDYGNDDDHTIGEGVFTKINTEDFVSATDASGNALTDSEGRTILVKNNRNENGFRSDYTLGNIIINPDVSQNLGKLPLTNAKGEDDYDRTQALVDAWNADFDSLNPESYANGNFKTFYNNFTGDFATIGQMLSSFVDYQETMVDGYDDQRQQTEGVSSDEELEKMIKYQQSYNAASRYVNVVSEMLEHLVTSLGNA